MSFHVPETCRIREGRGASLPSDGNNGAFRLGGGLLAIASDGEGWEHVSVSRGDRCPSWEDMCAAKALFWDPEDCVMQLHPPKSEYVNVHPYCLHLWRPTEGISQRPPSWMVGPGAVR